MDPSFFIKIVIIEWEIMSDKMDYLKFNLSLNNQVSRVDFEWPYWRWMSLRIQQLNSG